MRILIAALFSSYALAQSSTELKTCMDKADTQLAMNTCAGDEAKRVDALMASVYKQLVTAVRKEPEALQKIEASQKAWTAYRDSSLDAMYPAEDKTAKYGSIWGTNYPMLRASLTTERIARLKELLKAYRTGVH